MLARSGCVNPGSIVTHTKYAAIHCHPKAAVDGRAKLACVTCTMFLHDEPNLLAQRRPLWNLPCLLGVPLLGVAHAQAKRGEQQQPRDKGIKKTTKVGWARAHDRLGGRGGSDRLLRDLLHGGDRTCETPLHCSRHRGARERIGWVSARRGPVESTNQGENMTNIRLGYGTV